MSTTLRLPEHLENVADVMADGDREQRAGLVFAASGTSLEGGWEAVAAELREAFELSRSATREGGSIIYLVSSEDLLGQNGPERAMVACGLLSGARAVAFEGAKSGYTANVLAYEEATPTEELTGWVRRMLTSAGVNGELIRIGSGHLGRALP